MSSLTEERFWCPFFVRPKQIILIKRSLVFQNTEMGAKTTPCVLKQGYFDGRVPKLSFLVTLATSGAGMGIILYANNIFCINLASEKSMCVCVYRQVRAHILFSKHVFVQIIKWSYMLITFSILTLLLMRDPPQNSPTVVISPTLEVRSDSVAADYLRADHR